MLVSGIARLVERKDEEAPAIATAKRILDARRRRSAAFPDISFGEPAWDIMLDLFIAREEGQRVSTSSLCSAAGVPMTTALRWVTKMTADGVLVRTADAQDGRRFFFTLSDDVHERMLNFLDESASG
jgi:hypothetical protein